MFASLIAEMEEVVMGWNAIEYEEVPWHIDPDERIGLSKTARRKIGSTYRAAVPLTISGLSLSFSQDINDRIVDITTMLARFDAEQRARGYDLPALLLRSESAASSQIENLTSSVRNVAIAEISDQAPKNAQLVSGNIAAMKRALLTDGDLDIDSIFAIHRVLINRCGQTFGGALRDEQVWVGGSAFSPHGALYVPPRAERVPAYLDDLVAFAHRADVNPVAKAAIFHAQFETVYPFIDGNGRCGRALVHKMLKDEELLGQTTLPVSAGLLHNIDGYMASLDAYHDGDYEAPVIQLLDALEIACVVGKMAAKRLDGVIEMWSSALTQRKGSSIYRLIDVLVEQPVVNRSYLADRLQITTRAASSLISAACEHGMLRPVNKSQRATFYQSDDVIEVLEDISDMHSLRRSLATGMLG